MIQETEISIIGPHDHPTGLQYRIEARAHSPIQAANLLTDLWKCIATLTREQPVFIRVPPTISRFEDFSTKLVCWKGFTRFTVMKDRYTVKEEKIGEVEERS